jgi:glycosyltransferase involved in cell wall biosynthesis
MNSLPNLHNLEILVSGVIRNGETTLGKSISEIISSLPEFKRIHILIVESDSSDNTVGELEKIAEIYPDFSFITLGNLQERMPSRTERIAYARNVYLSEFQKNSKYKACSFLLVSDLDGITELLKKESFINCFKDEITVHTANQAAPYFDIWALRHPLWSPNDCWAEHTFFRSKFKWPETSLQKSILSRMITLPPNTELIEVESAFGGLAVYPRKSLINAQYEGLSGDGTEICEHVTLNRCIKRNGYKIVVNPSLINTGYTSHTIEKKFRYKLLRYLKYPFKALSKI